MSFEIFVLVAAFALVIWLALEIAAVFFGTMPDETLSAAAHRRGWKRTERLINRLFNDPSHCHDAYIAELRGDQNATEYHK